MPLSPIWTASLTRPTISPIAHRAITDLGYNISSDATPDFSQKSSFVADPVLDTALSTPGSTTVGPQH